MCRSHGPASTKQSDSWDIHRRRQWSKGCGTLLTGIAQPSRTLAINEKDAMGARSSISSVAEVTSGGMPKMNLRLVILTEIIAPYRIPVFNVLARRAGLDLHVIFLAETDERLRQWRVYKDEICFSHQILPSWRWRAGRGNFLINRGLWSALNNANPQVIICGGYNYAASWEALLWARRQRVPFVLWSESNSHDARAGRAWVESLKAYFLRHCDRFVVPGKASFEYLKMLGGAEASILTAPNAVDNGLFATQAESTLRHATQFRDRLKLPSRFILFVGRLVPEKGVFDLLEAYAKLQSGVRLEVS